MGLGGIAWLKTLLRTDPYFKESMHSVSAETKREEGFDVVMVELMLRKRALVKGCQTLGQYARRWITLAEDQLRRFPDARVMLFLFDDETNVPYAKGETQKGRRRNVLTAEEQILLGPYRYLCNTDPREFDTRINALFGAEAMRRERAGRTKVSAFEVFAEKHMATSALREDEFEFATRCIAAANYAQLGANPATGKPTCRIIVDRGVWRPSFERRLASDPVQGAEEPWHVVAASFPSPEARAIQTPPCDRLRLRLAALDQLAEEGREALEKQRDYAACVNRFERFVYMVRLGADEYTDRGHRIGRVEALLRRAGAMGAEHRQFAPRPGASTPSSGGLTNLEQHYAALVEMQTQLRTEFAEAALGVERELMDRSAPPKDEQGNAEIADVAELVEVANGSALEDALWMTAERTWVLIDETGVRRLDAMDGEHLVGEADLKIAHYARLFAGRDVFVVCHDSDLVLILLLMVKDWVPHPKRARRVEGRLWLDMTTASDLKKKPVPKGIIDMVEAWRGVHRWFADAYPAVRNPVEVFCMFLIMMGTDYVRNPPGLREVRLSKGFAALANRYLGTVIATDGLMGGALPSVRAPNPDLGALDGDDAAVVRLLRRNLVAGAFFTSEGSTMAELLPLACRHRYIAVHENGLIRYFTELFHEVGPKDRRKWPGDNWWRAQARRVIWQMGYWYGGDTLAGRVCDDEMLSIPKSLEAIHNEERGMEDIETASMYGWEWHPVGDTSQFVENRLGVRTALDRGRKRKGGSLGRHKPRNPPCESGPAEPVAPLRMFKMARRERYTEYRGWLDDVQKEKKEHSSRVSAPPVM